MWSMTWGVVPTKREFVAYVTRAINPETDLPYWDGRPFTMELRGSDADVAELADVPEVFMTPEELLTGVSNLLRFSRHTRNAKLAEVAESLASSIMSVVGIEWI